MKTKILLFSEKIIIYNEKADDKIKSDKNYFSFIIFISTTEKKYKIIFIFKKNLKSFPKNWSIISKMDEQNKQMMIK